ncbi:MAG: ABC transporter substrate-binding protein [Defluviitaleaceae bacterium]|nr:ABC transporter substrate-binding protein [Defluviitaleaceae bacterium]
MKKKSILGLILTGALLTGVLSSCAPQVPQPAPDAQAAAPTGVVPGRDQAVDRGVILAITAETPSIAVARHSALIGHYKNILTNNGLFRMDYNLNQVLDLAASMEAISDTIFEFRLHEGIMFHNGEEMTAYDVIASLEYVRTYPYQNANHGSVVGWEVIDRYTLRLDTGEPNAMMAFELAHQANFIMPRSLIESGHDFTADPVGSGPFVFESWAFGDNLHYVRFDDYFDQERFPMISYLNWRIIPEGASRTIALETGEVHYLVDVPFPDVPRLEENPNVNVIAIPGATYNYLLLNHNRPQFENVIVRKAIDMAIDKEAGVLAGFDGWGIPTWSMVPPQFAGVSAEGQRTFDPEGARALLAQHNIDPATLSFDMLVYDEEKRRMGEVVQANLADIGIETTITMMDFAAWMTQTLGDYDAAFARFTSANLLSFMRTCMHIDFLGTQNRSNMYNRELSDLITQAVATVDEPARLAILYEATRMANDLAVWVPTNMNIAVRAANANLIVPETAGNGFMFFNMMYWVE